ncbi:hypothetical protein MAHJHV45_30230 [Mycobacterium avium subsp. hominissuis]
MSGMRSAPVRRAPRDGSETGWTGGAAGAWVPLSGRERQETMRGMVGHVDIDLMAWRLRVTPGGNR